MCKPQAFLLDNVNIRKRQDLDNGLETYDIEYYQDYSLYYKVDYVNQFVGVLIECYEDSCWLEGCEDHDCDADIDCDFEHAHIIEMSLSFDDLELPANNDLDVLSYLVASFGVNELLDNRDRNWYKATDESFDMDTVIDARGDYIANFERI